MSVLYKWRKTWSLNEVKLGAWPKTIPFEQLKLFPWACCCLLWFCVVTFGVLCQALSIASCPGFLQHLLAEAQAGDCPFPSYTIAATHSDLCGFQGCCRGGWLLCSPADIPWVCRLFQLKRPSPCLSFVGVTIWGMEITGVFFWLAHPYWKRGLLEDSWRKGALLSGRTYPLRWEIWVKWFILSCFLRKKYVYGQFKGIQNFRCEMASERICFELPLSAGCQYCVL